MSTMLEDEAIVDATKIKNAARKNAKNTILEQYSAEIKDAVSVLLEQELDPEAMFSDQSAEDVDLNAEVGISEKDQATADQVPFRNSELLGQEGSNTSPGAPSSESEDVEVTIDLQGLAQSLSPDLYDLDVDQEEAESVENLSLGEEEPAPVADLEGEETPAAEGGEDDLDELDLLEEAIEIILKEDKQLAEIQEQVKEVAEGLKFDYEPKPTGWGFGANTPTSYRLEAKELADAVEKLKAKNEELEEKNKNQKEEYGELRESFDILENIHEDLKDKNLKLMQLAKKLESKLNEVNLANAKLTYTNRALNSPSLNERQKEKLVESISKANTIEEAKVIFDTLKDAVGSFSQNEKKPKSLSEAISRSASPFFPKRETSVSSEQKIFVNKMQRLAGIKS